MYLPKQFAETRIPVLHQLARAHSLATLIAVVDGELLVNHVPLLLDAEPAPYGTLRGHLARANPAAQAFTDSATDTLAVFQGPHSYISPSWYPSKRAHGKVVPTWNYAVVHAHGSVRTHHDADWLLAHVSRLSDTHEASQDQPWRVDDAPPEFIDKMLTAIVGIEIPIRELNGKWKMSQNRSPADRGGVLSGLQARTDQHQDARAGAVAELMREPTEP